MRYVQRDGSGKVIGHFANKQSYAEEEVADDHADILARDEEIRLARLAATSISGLLLCIEDLEARVAALGG